MKTLIEYSPVPPANDVLRPYRIDLKELENDIVQTDVGVHPVRLLCTLASDTHACLGDGNKVNGAEE